MINPIDPMKVARRIHPVFVREGWEWHTKGVPSELEIAKTIRHLIEVAETHGDCETGRIHVHLDDDFGMRVMLVVGEELDGD